MKDFVSIDGLQGEGGGQVLRTALSLSAITGTEIEFRKIRAGRTKPGLKRQHLTCVKAVAEICGAKVSEVAVGNEVVTAVRDFLKAGKACEKHLADQLLLPLNVFVGGERRLEQVGEYWEDLVWHPSWDIELQKETLHYKTNQEVVAEFGLHE